MLDLITIGEELRRRRKAAKLTQGALAERARVGRATIAALERGRLAELGFNKLMSLLAVVGADLRIIEENRNRPTLEDLMGEGRA